MKTIRINFLTLAPVLGTLSDLEKMTEAEILAKSGPIPLTDDRFDYRPFFFAATRKATHVFTSHERETAWDAIQTAKRLFAKPVREHTAAIARVEMHESGEGPSTLSSAGFSSAQPELPLLW